MGLLHSLTQGAKAVEDDLFTVIPPIVQARSIQNAILLKLTGPLLPPHKSKSEDTLRALASLAMLPA